MLAKFRCEFVFLTESRLAGPRYRPLLRLEIHQSGNQGQGSRFTGEIKGKA